MCEWCDDLGKYKSIYAEIEEQTKPDEVFNWTMPVNFCPNCGQPLSEPK